MAIKAIDHLYLETRSFDDSVAFWERLGFRLTSRWGNDGHRAGRLESGDAFIVLAEGSAPVHNVHFRLENADELAQRLAAEGGVEVETPLQPTHWGTRWLRVKDPDGRVFALEETGLVT